MACNVLTRCQESSSFAERPSELITRVLSNWGNMTCLNLAESSQLLQFLSHSVVKNYLHQKWNGGLMRDNLIRPGWASYILEPVWVSRKTFFYPFLTYVVQSLVFVCPIGKRNVLTDD